MSNTKLYKLIFPLVMSGSLLTLPYAAQSAPIIYEHLPESNSNFVSHHDASGPILADDFDPARGGRIVQAEWWGSAATSSLWELTLHRGHLNPGGVGEPIPQLTAFRKEFVTAVGEDLDGDGIFHFEAALPGNFSVNAGPVPFGSEYWFSIANDDDGWTWAFAGAGPTVGDEHWHAVRSTGDPSGCEGGPHCGPWNEIEGRDFAFRLEAVPEPSVLSLLLVSAVAGVGLRLRRR